MSLLSSLVVLLVNAPTLPAGECIPPASSMVFPETRVEILDVAGATLQTGLSEADLDKTLAKQGAAMGHGVLVVAVPGQKGRFEAIELQPSTPVHLVSYAGDKNPDKAAPKGEHKLTGEIVPDGQGFTVNITEQVVADGKVVAHETRSHWIERRDGRLQVMAALRCGLGERSEIPAPRWKVGERVDVVGCGGDIWFPRTMLEGCAVGVGGGPKRASEYVDLSNELEFGDLPMHRARILRLGLGTSGATIPSKAASYPSLWSHYGMALMDALKKGEAVSTWEIINAYENAMAADLTDFAKGYAGRLLGDAYVAMAERAQSPSDKKATLEKAITAFGRSLKLQKDRGTAERLAAAKKMLESVR